MPIPWTEARFRSSARFELKRIDDLPLAQRDAMRELESDDDFYGLLVPRQAGSANIKSVGQQTATLFRELVNPTVLDADGEQQSELVDLVLDGVFEVESGASFVSGAAAFPLLCTPAAELDASHALGAVSRDALLHAAEIETSDPAWLTSALYFYNRVPISRFWSTRFPDRDAVAAHLGIRSGSLRTVLEQHWVETPVAQARGWLSWSPRSSRKVEGRAHKLYVSPRPERIRDAFTAVVHLLARFPGAAMKVGQDASGLLRPDKLVTYFASRADLDDAAAELARELSGCPAQGVPFTAALGDDGLLSWGIDPPDSERALSWLSRESWRLWLCTRMGAALSIAKASPSAELAPWQFAIERVRRHGVDVDTWTAADHLWRGAA